jgi:hypothetical protein
MSMLNYLMVLWEFVLRKFRIDLMPGAVPKHFRLYAIPVIHLEAFKKELIHLVEIGVFSPQGASEWASPTFITSKKDSRVHWVSGLRWKTDDIGAFSNLWEEHMALLSKILTLMQENGFTVNPLKYEWAVKETD